MALCQCLTCDVRLFQKLVIIHNLRWQELNTSADISRKTKSQHDIPNGPTPCTTLLSKTAINHDRRWVGWHLVGSRVDASRGCSHRHQKGVGQVLPLKYQNHDVTWWSRQLFYHAHLIQLVKTPKTNVDSFTIVYFSAHWAPLYHACGFLLHVHVLYKTFQRK